LAVILTQGFGLKFATDTGLALMRRGQVVIVSANGTGDLEFESCHGVCFLRIWTLEFALLLCIL
jgi:hypothetical protein